MARIKTKTKKFIKIISLVLAGVVAIGLMAWGIKALVSKTHDSLKTIHPTFEVGKLGEDGKYVKDETMLYTKDAFQCDGLQVKLDFDNEIKYQIFFYDDLDNFIESTDVLTEAYSGGVHDSYARIVIIPKNDEDNKVSFMERKKTYPGQIEIKVSKTQNTKYYDVGNSRLRLSSIGELQFYHGSVDMVNGTLAFLSSTSSSEVVTSRQLVAVKPGNKIKCNLTIQNNVVHYFAFQLKEVNGKLILVSRLYGSGADQITISDGVDYVVFSLFAIDSGETHRYSFTDSDLERSNTFMSFVK